MTDNDDEKCLVCEDWILPDDLIEEITSIQLDDEADIGTFLLDPGVVSDNEIESHIILHAGCFMDLVVIDDVRGGKINRTAIMEGRVKRREDKDNNYYLEVL